MAIVTTNDQHYHDIADAIRKKNGSDTQYTPAEVVLHPQSRVLHLAVLQMIVYSPSLLAVCLHISPRRTTLAMPLRSVQYD